jgi:MFS family permease
VNWLPTYLREQQGGVQFGGLELGPFLTALLAGLPLLLGGFGCLVSAWVLPRLARRLNSVRLARRCVALVGFVGASACIFIFTGIQHPIYAMIVLGFAGFFNDVIMPAAWAGTMDIGGRYAGTVSGAMNMMGSIAGAFSVTVVGYILTWTNDNWTLTFMISSGIYLIGAVCWLFLDSHSPVEPVESVEAAA